MQAVALHVDFSAPNRVFVRGWGIDAEFGGAVAITGTLKEPLFDGALESKRGRYEEFGRVFNFDHAYLRFQGTVPPSPYLDIQAVTKLDDITAQVNLTGPVKEPAIALSAVPAMPQDEVMSHILFGKDMSKISPFQAVQLASSLHRLTGKGSSGFEPLGAIRKATGLENLQVETDENGGTTVGAGKYITDKVYLEAEKGSGEKSGAAALKIDITPHLKAESKIGQDNKSGGSLNWEWDY
jgi:translocation and assembly module TamB